MVWWWWFGGGGGGGGGDVVEIFVVMCRWLWCISGGGLVLMWW